MHTCRHTNRQTYITTERQPCRHTEKQTDGRYITSQYTSAYIHYITIIHEYIHDKIDAYIPVYIHWHCLHCNTTHICTCTIHTYVQRGQGGREGAELLHFKTEGKRSTCGRLPQKLSKSTLCWMDIDQGCQNRAVPHAPIGRQ